MSRRRAVKFGIVEVFYIAIKCGVKFKDLFNIRASYRFKKCDTCLQSNLTFRSSAFHQSNTVRAFHFYGFNDDIDRSDYLLFIICYNINTVIRNFVSTMHTVFIRL